MQINITDDEIKYLSQQAEQELATIATQYIKSVVDEAGRLEIAERGNDGEPEITRVHVRDAITSLRRNPQKPKKSARFIVLKLTASLFTLLVGILAPNIFFPDDPTKLNLFWYIFFAILLATAIVTTTLDIIFGSNQ